MDGEIYLELDAVLKSFGFTNVNVFHVLATTLQNISAKLSMEKIVRLHDEVAENLHNVDGVENLSLYDSDSK